MVQLGLTKPYRERLVYSDFHYRLIDFSASNELGKEIQKKSSLRSLGIRLHQSLSICLSLCSICLQIPFCLKIASLFISQDPSPSMAQKIRVFNTLVLERETSLRCDVPEATEICHSGSLQRRPPRYYEALRRSVECLAAPYRGSTAALLCASLLWFFLLLFSFLFGSNIDTSYKTL